MLSAPPWGSRPASPPRCPALNDSARRGCTRAGGTTVHSTPCRGCRPSIPEINKLGLSLLCAQAWPSFLDRLGHRLPRKAPRGERSPRALRGLVALLEELAHSPRTSATATSGSTISSSAPGDDSPPILPSTGRSRTRRRHLRPRVLHEPESSGCPAAASRDILARYHGGLPLVRRPRLRLSSSAHSTIAARSCSASSTRFPAADSPANPPTSAAIRFCASWPSEAAAILDWNAADLPAGLLSDDKGPWSAGASSTAVPRVTRETIGPTASSAGPAAAPPALPRREYASRYQPHRAPPAAGPLLTL